MIAALSTIPALGIVLMLREVRRAPERCEDERGFHFGREEGL